VASAGKKLLVLLVASVVACGLLELAATLLYARVKQRPFVRAEVRARLLAGAPPDSSGAAPTAVENDPRVADQRVIIHPYFGYIVDPGTPHVNPYGFYGPEPLATRSPDAAIVAVFGGSVADQLVKIGGDALREALAARRPFAGQHIELINLALGGYKQPQQLLVLTTLLALGAQFDLVINLDGFNEVDGAKDNQQDGVNPFYPYTWNLHARRGLDSTAMVHMAKADLIRARREELRRWFARPPLWHSAFALTLWEFLDQREEAALAAETVALRTALAQSATSPQQTGPPVRYADDEAMYLDYAEVWARSSLEMEILCSGYGIRYVHFLQPNQYLTGSKTLTAEERATAYDQDVADTHRIDSAYPVFIDRGLDLRTQGVEFVDLTLLFRDEARTVYSDTCCHLNELGNRELAEAIAAEVAAGSAEATPEPAADEPAPE
jgi:hypothetical protein